MFSVLKAHPSTRIGPGTMSREQMFHSGDTRPLTHLSLQKTVRIAEVGVVSALRWAGQVS